MRRIALFLIVFMVSTAFFAIEIGQKAPGLMISQWIKNGPVELYSKKGGQKSLKADYYVIFFFATWANVSKDAVGFVDGLTDVFKDADVKFIGISSENAQRVKTYFEKYPITKICVGVDDHNKTSNEYLGGEDTIPRFFVFDKSKKLIWKGDALEVNRVLINLVGGTFDPDKQLEIEKLHADIRGRVQSLDREGQLKVASEIFKIDPTDRVALDFKIDELIRQNKLEDCISLIKEARRAAGSNNYNQYYLYNVELDIETGMLNERGKQLINDLAKNYYQTFQNSPTALNSMAYRLIMGVPFQITDIEQALKMSDQAVKLQTAIDSKSNDMGTYLQTEARCDYLLGKFNDAIAGQKQAIECLRSKEEKDAANLALQYYEKVRSIAQSAN